MNVLKKLLKINPIKTLYFNLYYLPIKDAILFPFRVGWNTKIGSMGSRNSVIVENCHQHIAIGMGESFALGNRTYWHLQDGAVVHFYGGATIGKGSQIVVSGLLDVGGSFYCNANCIINVGSHVTIGDDFLCGWNCNILDGDGHKVVHLSQKVKKPNILIGKHVWCAANVSILKGTQIPSNSVISFGTVYHKSYNQENILIGNNNQILSEGISWEK